MSLSLLDKDGNPMSSEQKNEETESTQEEHTEQQEPDFAPLVRSYNQMTKAVLMDYFNRAKMLNIQIDQNQAMQLANIVQDAMFNMVFSKLYDEGYTSMDQIIDEEKQELLRKLVDFKKNIDTYSPEDLEMIDKANKNNK